MKKLSFLALCIPLALLIPFSSIAQLTTVSKSMTKGQQFSGETILQNGNYRLSISRDGNLEIQDLDSRKITWSLGVKGQGSNCKLQLQEDGNLCYKKGDNSFIWCSAALGAKVVLEDDGRLVQYDQLGKEVWASYMPVDRSGATLKKGQLLEEQQRLFSKNRKYFLVVRGNGNLNVRETKTKKLIWALNQRQNGPGCQLKLEELDGNLCFYNRNKEAIWCSMAFGSKLVVEDDGRLVQYDYNNKAVWTSEMKTAPNDPNLTSGGNNDSNPANNKKYEWNDVVCVTQADGSKRTAIIIGDPLFGPNRTAYKVSYMDNREQADAEPATISDGECPEGNTGNTNSDTNTDKPADTDKEPVEIQASTVDMLTLEQEIIKEVNRLRANPRVYAAELRKLKFKPYTDSWGTDYKMYAGNDRLWYCSESDAQCRTDYQAKINDAIVDLESIQGSLSSVNENKNINQAAKFLAADTGQINGREHKDSKGRGIFCRTQTAGYMHRAGECLNAGRTTARGFVVSFLSSKFHRKILIDPSYEEIGVDTHFHEDGYGGFIRNVIIMGDKDVQTGANACQNGW